MVKKRRLCLALTVCFAVAASFFAAFAASGASAEQTPVYTDYFGDYQGYKDFYYLEGDFAANDLHRMLLAYNEDGSCYWQGNGWWHRISANLSQCPDGVDSVRAYRVPYDGKLTIKGTVKNTCSVSNGVGDGVKVSIVRRPYQSYNVSEADVALLPETALAVGDADIDLGTVAALKDIEVLAGDVIYFVAKMNATPNGDLVTFEVVPEFSEKEDPAEERGDTVFAASLPLSDNFSYTVREEDNVLQINKADDVVYPAVNSVNVEGLRRDIVAGNRTLGYIKVNKTPKEGDANNYDANLENVFVFYGNQFCANPDKQIGIRYLVPKTGLVDINAVLTGETVTGWNFVKRSDGVYTDIKKINCTGVTAADLITTADVPELSKIPVKAGDEIYALATSTDYWKKTYAFITIDYRATVSHELANPPDVYNPAPDMGELTEEELNQAEVTSQGQNGFYKLAGSSSAYSKLIAEGGKWINYGASPEIDKEIYKPAVGGDAILMYRVEANGTLALKGYASMESAGAGDGTGVTLIKKSAGISETLFSVSYDRPYTKIIDFNAEVKSGDAFFLCVSAGTNATDDAVKVKLNAALTPDASPGTPPGDDIGDSLPAALDYKQFGGAQGADGWYKVSGSESAYFAMAADPGNGNYTGTTDGIGIWWKETLGIRNAEKSILLYKAPFNGTVRFNGSFAFTSEGIGEGVSFELYKKNGPFAQPSLIKRESITSETVYRLKGDAFAVQSGEIYIFAFKGLGNDTDKYKQTAVNLNAYFTQDSENPGEEADSEIGLMPSYTQDEYDKYFSNEQGKEHYYFLYGNPEGNYSYMTYNSSAQKWVSSEEYCAIEKNNQHPGIAEDAIRAYRVPADGNVDATGKISGGYGGGSDGIIFSVYIKRVSDGGLGSAEKIAEDIILNAASASAAINIRGIEVKRGDLLMFAVNCNTGNPNDSTALNLYIDFTKTADGTDPDTGKTEDWEGQFIGCARKIDFTSYYSNEQGKNGWFYAYGGADKYALMNYRSGNDGNLKWNGREDWLSISADNQHPGNELGAVRIFVAEASGRVSVEGAAVKLTASGDGIYAAIFHNDKKLWEKSFAASDTKPVDMPAALKNLEVKKGDKLFFAVTSGENKNNSNDGFLFKTEVIWNDKGSDRVEGEDLSAYLSPVTYAELLGVNIVEQDEEEDLSPKTTGCGAMAPFNGSDGGLNVLLICFAAAALFAAYSGKRKLKGGEAL